MGEYLHAVIRTDQSNKIARGLIAGAHADDEAMSRINRKLVMNDVRIDLATFTDGAARGTPAIHLKH